MMTDVSKVVQLGPLQRHVDSFLDHLHARGYVPESITYKGSIAIAFARWSQRERINQCQNNWCLSPVNY